MNIVMLRLFVFIVFCNLNISGCAQEQAKRRACIGTVCVITDVADTDEKRAKGLMFRETLKDGHGMLFVFEKEAVYRFWMKNMRFSLDFIWISRSGRIVDIDTDIPPCMEEPCQLVEPSSEIKYVLEVPAGFVKKRHIKIGDEVVLK